MTTIIFKSDKKAKVYKILAKVSHGCYNAGELIRIVRTDNITKVLHNEEVAEEVAEKI